MQIKPTKNNLVLQWIGINSLAFSLATTLCFSIRLSSYNIEILFLVGLIVGTITGIPQVYVLQQQFPKLRYWQWILANILGSYAGTWGGLYAANFNPQTPAIALLIFGGVVGLCIGIAQGIVFFFRAQGAWLWSLANVLGRAIAWLAGGFLVKSQFPAGFSIVQQSILGLIVAGGLGGLIYGIVTGLALRLIAVQTAKNTPLK